MDLDHKRVLIIKPSSLGDVVHALPVVHAIKRVYPRCYVAWIVQSSFAGILENDPTIDELIPISIPSTSDPAAERGAYRKAAAATAASLRDLRQRFRRAPFDLALDLHASFRSGLFALACRGARRIGFSDAKELNTWFQDEYVRPPEDALHAVEKNLACARYLGVEPAPQDFRVVVGDQQRLRVQSFLAECGIAPDAELVYVNACARWTTKLWNVEAWAAVCRLLKERRGVHIVLGGAPGDRPYLETIRGAAHTELLITAGELTLAESAALLELSDLYLGVDSGPMHIAAFVDTPVVALFGPTDPAKVGPYGEGHEVARREDLPCLGCRKRFCDNPRCMDELDPVEVARICQTVLARRSTAQSRLSRGFKS
ncbi:MAG: glycosyltransferase family 9 protein [Desulfomonilaceae bacterium]